MKLSEYTFTSMTGLIGVYGVQVEDESRPGIDGHTFRQLGFRGEQFTIQTRATFIDKEAAQQGVLDYERLRGYFHVLEDTIGTSYRKVLVLRVGTQIFPIQASTDSNTYLIEASWTLQRAG